MSRLTETAQTTENLFETAEKNSQDSINPASKAKLGPPETEAENPALEQFLALPEFSYAIAENAPYYRRMLRILNQRRHQPPVSAEEMKTLMEQQYEIQLTVEDAQRFLESLEAWGNVEGHQSLKTRVSSAKEFGRKNMRYRITEKTHRLVECEKSMEKIIETAGSLQGHRLPAIHAALKELANQLEKEKPEPEALAAQLTQVKGALEELKHGADNFSVELNKMMFSTEKLEIEHFQEYCSNLVNYLEDFSATLQKWGGRIRQQIERIDKGDPEKMFELIAQLHMAPNMQGDRAEALLRAAEEPRAHWESIRSGFVPIQTSRMQELDHLLTAAARWCVETGRRISERGVHRTDRASEYMHLAQLFSECTTDQQAHQLSSAAFGMWSARHLHGGGEDDNLKPEESLWEAEPEQIIITPQQHSIAAEAKKGPPVRRAAELQAQIKKRRERRRAEEQRVLAAFSGGVKLLSELNKLSAEEFKHLRNWIGRALEAPEEEDGSRRAESLEGGAIIVLRQKGKTPAVTLVTDQGSLDTPDFEIEVERI